MRDEMEACSKMPHRRPLIRLLFEQLDQAARRGHEYHYSLG